MRIPRVYYPEKIKTKKKILLNSEIYHYLINVLRLKKNEIIEIFNNSKNSYLATINSIKKKKIIVEIYKEKKNSIKEKYKIHLGQIISEKKKFTFIIEKSVELGVFSITPIFINKKKYWNNICIKKNIDYWKKIIISACGQSNRNTLPILYDYIQLSDLFSKIPLEYQKIVFHTKSKNSINNIINFKKKNIFILIGSETGFSENTIKELKKNNFLDISLGPRVLKMETASIVGITAVQLLFNNW